MHTKKQEILVYIVGGIGFLSTFILNLKSGFSMDNLLAILKDLSPLMITIMIFYMLNGLFRSSDFERAANKAIEKNCQRYEDILSVKKENAGEWLFIEKKQKVPFIPLQPLREDGLLEIWVSFRTLDNFETISPKDVAEKEIRIANKKSLVKSKTIEMLQIEGAKFKVEPDRENFAVRIQFLPQSSYERILEHVINRVMILLKEKTDL